MSITITLTEAQALEIVSQLVNKNGGAVLSNTNNPRARILEIVQATPKDKLFSSGMLASELGIPGSTVSSALMTFAKKKLCKMEHRGTWRRL